MPPTILLTVLLLFFSAGVFPKSSSGGYVRPHPRKTLPIIPLEEDNSSSSPQQVHISLVGIDRVRVSWITKEDSPSIVEYGKSRETFNMSATRTFSAYSYIFYRSGKIHDVVIGPLESNTMYYYRCGGNCSSLSSTSTKEYSFKTPPAHLPLKFAIIGDLGQTGWTKSTLSHIAASDYDMLLLQGDLSYADTFQSLWDSFGLLVEPLASSRPWMVTQGNHEVEKIVLLERHPFKSYNARWRMPYEESNSSSNLYYSFEVVGVHVIMLGSYADFGSGSDQYKWLQADLARIDRGRTPWVIVLVHAPWYNTNTAHQGEGEDMRVAMEKLLFRAHVDAVFAGHVHAYERFGPVYNLKSDPCGPVHITIGDGGNREGLANKYLDPKPEWSLFREASFGHGELVVVNSTHAEWTWHRNDDDEAVVADRVWLTTITHRDNCRSN